MEESYHLHSDSEDEEEEEENTENINENESDIYEPSPEPLPDLDGHVKQTPTKGNASKDTLAHIDDINKVIHINYTYFPYKCFIHKLCDI